MIYDTAIEILYLPKPLTVPAAGTLVRKISAMCARKTVYAKRYWDAVSNDRHIDEYVELPMLRNVTGGDYARLMGHTYRVEQAQFGQDEDGLPVTWLSLMRMEDRYDTY